MAATSLVLTPAQFALAGLGAFAMDSTPPDGNYAAQVSVGMVIVALNVLILVAVLASRRARAHRRTLWLAVVLAVLSVAQPTLGAGGMRVPAVGALYALNGAAILAAVGWLTCEMAHRRAGATGIPRRE